LQVDQFNIIVDISITLILLVYAAVILSYIKLYSQMASKRHQFILLTAALFVTFALYAAGYKMVLFSLLLLGFGWPVRYIFNNAIKKYVTLSS